MKQILLVACALGLMLFDLAYSADAAPAHRPNIILVMADDLGWSDVGCYGGEIHTPQIDSLARDGLRFTQFYNNAVCGPTRASLLTELYCQQIGHRGDRWNEPKDFSKCITIAELLQAAGYRTMMVGKWQGRDLAVDRGFDRFFGPMCQAKISYFHEVDQNPYRLDREPWEVPPDFYLTDAINDFAVQFLKEAVGREQPFFLCKDTGVTKVYIETFRSNYLARQENLQRAKERFLAAGFDVSGCVTPTIVGKKSTGWNIISCYTDSGTQDHLREIFQFTAKLFDEIMIDDFWFTDCQCGECDTARQSKTVTIGDKAYFRGKTCRTREAIPLKKPTCRRKL